MCVCLVGRPPPGLMYGVAPVQRGFGPPPGWRPQFQFPGHPASPATRPVSAGPRPNPDSAASQRPPVTEQSAAGQPQPRLPITSAQLAAGQPQPHPHPPIIEQPSGSQPQPGMQFVPTQVNDVCVTTAWVVIYANKFEL